MKTCKILVLLFLLIAEFLVSSMVLVQMSGTSPTSIFMEKFEGWYNVVKKYFNLTLFRSSWNYTNPDRADWSSEEGWAIAYLPMFLTYAYEVSGEEKYLDEAIWFVQNAHMTLLNSYEARTVGSDCFVWAEAPFWIGVAKIHQITGEDYFKNKITTFLDSLYSKRALDNATDLAWGYGWTNPGGYDVWNTNVAWLPLFAYLTKIGIKDLTGNMTRLIHWVENGRIASGTYRDWYSYKMVEHPLPSYWYTPDMIFAYLWIYSYYPALFTTSELTKDELQSTILTYYNRTTDYGLLNQVWDVCYQQAIMTYAFKDEFIIPRPIVVAVEQYLRTTTYDPKMFMGWEKQLSGGLYDYMRNIMAYAAFELVPLTLKESVFASFQDVGLGLYERDGTIYTEDTGLPRLYYSAYQNFGLKVYEDTGTASPFHIVMEEFYDKFGTITKMANNVTRRYIFNFVGTDTGIKINITKQYYRPYWIVQSNPVSHNYFYFANPNDMLNIVVANGTNYTFTQLTNNTINILSPYMIFNTPYAFLLIWTGVSNYKYVKTADIKLYFNSTDIRFYKFGIGSKTTSWTDKKALQIANKLPIADTVEDLYLAVPEVYYLKGKEKIIFTSASNITSYTETSTTIFVSLDGKGQGIVYVGLGAFPSNVTNAVWQRFTNSYLILTVTLPTTLTIVKPTVCPKLVLNANVTNMNFGSNKLSLTLNAPTRSVSKSEIYVGDKGKPNTVIINSVEKRENAGWTYNETTRTVKVTVLLTSTAEVVLDWNPRLLRTYLTHSMRNSYEPREAVTINGKLTDELFKPLSNKTIRIAFSWSDVYSFTVTNGTGHYEFSFNAPTSEGLYNITVHFGGDSNNKEASITKEFTVKSTTSFPPIYLIIIILIAMGSLSLLTLLYFKRKTQRHAMKKL